ncbi:MAG: hypothetical protein ABII79_12495, partial [bacterium]
MKRFKISLLVVILALSFPVSSYGTMEITLDHVDGLIGGDSIEVGRPVRLVFRWTYMSGDGFKIGASCNAFRVYEKNGGDFYPPVHDTVTGFGWASWYTIVSFGCYSCDGAGDDTVEFGGYTATG